MIIERTEEKETTMSDAERIDRIRRLHHVLTDRPSERDAELTVAAQRLVVENDPGTGRPVLRWAVDARVGGHSSSEDLFGPEGVGPTDGGPWPDTASRALDLLWLVLSRKAEARAEELRRAAASP